ncbi:MAG: hypothetical protein ACN6OJ_03100 [Chryseobacterium sp.]|uniref:hypothetical protein n=1 Tax=Chryseobacterium sp. TaxID=1871047 RepID=UPI003D0BB0E7
MIDQAFADISACEFLIAESSEKAIGMGIEAGYSKGLGKRVMYIRHVNAEHFYHTFSKIRCHFTPT